MDSFHGLLFTHAHIYLVFYSKFTNNILVFTAVNDFLCMLELEQAPAKTYDSRGSSGGVRTPSIKF